MSQIALLTGPQDPSNLDAVVNSVIAQINGYLSGVTPIVTQVSAASTTGTAISAVGLTTLTTTKASDTYTLASPVIGQQKILFCTKTTTGATHMAITMASTAVRLSTTIKKIIFATKNQCLTLIGLSSTTWGITSNVGTVQTS
jgi:hypothetical protein